MHEDQTTSICQSFDTQPLTIEYTPLFNRLHGVVPTKKRKHGAAKAPISAAESMKAAPTGITPTQERSNDGNSIHLEEEDLQTTKVRAETTPSVESNSHVVKVNREDDDEEDEKTESKPGTADRNGNYYYLLKPHTSGSQKVLIPLSPSACLLDCLRNQTVLEFPTIHVLSQGPESPPEGFLIEDEYAARFKAEQDEMQRLIAEAGDIETGPDDAKAPSGSDSIPSAHDIIAILERDIGGQ